MISGRVVEYCRTRAIALWAIAAMTSFGASSVCAQEVTSPRETIDAWVQFWSTYDLDELSELFVTDESVTYFSSEKEGLISGNEELRAHHEGFGFVPGGAPATSELWLEDIVISPSETAPIVSAIWFFGDRIHRQTAQRGPMTAVLTRFPSGFRIRHMHFGNYPSLEN